MVSVFGVKFSLEPLNEQGGAGGAGGEDVELVFDDVFGDDMGDSVDEACETSVC